MIIINSSLLGEYNNGNYNIRIFNDGTKIRETREDEFIPEFPESIDLKITNQCNRGCSWCHENSKPEGKHGDILGANFIRYMNEFTEVAIGGGNPLLHPDLSRLLQILKEKKVIANITLNQYDFRASTLRLENWTREKLIYGIGVSLVQPDRELVSCLKMFPNSIIHVINGVIDPEDLKIFYGKGLKLLVLGYKQWRLGQEYYQDKSFKIEKQKNLLKKSLPEIIANFSVVSFDNLAIEQLNLKELLSEQEWNKFYMGDDGQFTMYVDLVGEEFACSSTSEKRFPLMSDIGIMFRELQPSNKYGTWFNATNPLINSNFKTSN